MSPRDDYTRGARCLGCYFTPGLCVCTSLPTLELPFHVGLIRHRTEIELVSNTGRFVPKLLADASVHELGLHGSRFDGSWLEDPSRDLYVLYPDPGARPLTPAVLGDRPLTLVVLDATWRKARRMIRRVSELHSLPRVALPYPRPAGLSPRKAPDPMAHCTIEAVAAAVAALGFREEGALLWEQSRALIERIRHVQGRVPRPEETAGSPGTSGATPGASADAPGASVDLDE